LYFDRNKIYSVYYITYIIVSLFLFRNCDIQFAFALVLSMSFVWLIPRYIFNCRRKLSEKKVERRKSVIRP